MGYRISDFDPLTQIPTEGWLEIISRSGLKWMNRRISVETLRTGLKGKSAYEIAVEYGFPGTEIQWLSSLKGKSAFDAAVENGFQGTRDDWIRTMEALYQLEPQDAGKVMTNDGQNLGWMVLTPTHLGLDQVDNTSDMDKPVSTATQQALDAKLNTVEFGQYFTGKMGEVGIVHDPDTDTWVHDQGSLP